MKFSIIVPTIGRPTLANTLKSIMHQLGPDDQLIVVSDGPIGIVSRMSDLSDYRVTYRSTAVTNDNGATQRDRGISAAWGDVLLFMDDDDIYTKNAFATIRAAIKDTWGLPHIFRMRAGANKNFLGDLWRVPKIEYGNVGTPMIVLPRLATMPEWAAYDKNSHDFGFILQSVNERYGGQAIWHEDVISIIRPTDEQLRAELPDA